MTQVLAQQLVFSNAQPAYSRAFSLNGENAIDFTTDVVKAGGDAVGACAVEISNDLQNWQAPVDETALDGLGSFSAEVSGIATRYARLKYSVSSGTGTMVVQATVDTSSQ